MELENRNEVPSIDKILLYFRDMLAASTLRCVSIVTGAAPVIFHGVSSQEDSMDRVNYSTDRRWSVRDDSQDHRFTCLFSIDIEFRFKGLMARG
jgi:hypothetical protein